MFHFVELTSYHLKYLFLTFQQVAMVMSILQDHILKCAEKSQQCLERISLLNLVLLCRIFCITLW